MKITLMTFGTRGDTQPFLALAAALRQRGHDAVLVAPIDFEALAAAHRVPYVSTPGSSMEFVQRSSTRQLMGRNSPATLIAYLRETMPRLKAVLESTLEISAEASRNADLIIAHSFMLPFAYSIHQHLRIPLLLGIAAPVLATRQFPSPAFPPRRFGQQLYNPLTHYLLLRAAILPMIALMKRYRQQVGLPSLSAGKLTQIFFGGQIPILMHYSSHVGLVASDWNMNVHITGAWPLPTPQDWIPPNSLSEFLDKGKPPVFFGFGSMPIHNPAQMSQIISQALRLANLRGVLQAGWGGLTQEDEHLITIGDMPHDWLFPRMATIVHHGGSGTTHSALSAAKPSLVVPFMADQSFWGRRLTALGMSVPPIAPKKLTPERLAEALRTLMENNAIHQRATNLGTQLRAEDGLAAACDLSERFVS